MVKPKTINPADTDNVAALLLHKMRNNLILLVDETVSNKSATRELESASGARGKEEKAELLLRCCERHIDDKKWVRLKAAVRKLSQRKTRLGQTESITISKRAHQLLTIISQRNCVTFSETLEYYLGRACNGEARA